MTRIEKAASYVVNIFAAEDGYIEKASNSNLDSKTGNAGSANYTKYARDIDQITGFYNTMKQGYDWCDVSHDWAHVMAWGGDLAKKVLYQPDYSCGAGCDWSAGYYRNNGAFFKTPKVGDQIFFGTTGHEKHTGMVRAVDSKYVYTVEGNTSNSVRLKSYLLTDSSIVGYGRPNYALVADRFEDDSVAPKLDNIPSEWFEEDVAWALRNKIMVGDDNGDLMLRKCVTREELMAFLHRVVKLINE